MSIPSSGFGEASGGPIGLGLISSEQMTNNFFGMQTNMQNRALGETSSSYVSKLDLKAPGRARHEYEIGYRLLNGKDYQGAIAHLSTATQIYPSFVAAHNALGSAYLNLGQNEQARQEFSQAATLDDHLPNSHLNLGVAHLALKNYAAAQESLEKAASIAPLDLSMLRARAYGEFANKDYPAVIATTRDAHKRKHEGAAVVHFFAAGAFEAQNNLPQAQHELETLLREEPKIDNAAQIKQLLQQLKDDQAHPPQAKQKPAEPITFSFAKTSEPTSDEATKQSQKILQDLKEKQEIAEAEAADSKVACATCDTTSGQTVTAANTGGLPDISNPRSNGITTLRASVDEVAIFFAATDHGKSVTDLSRSDVAIRDNQQMPAAILGFRSQADLPLRMGLVIDISDSVSHRFAFEQKAAIDFLHKAVTGKDDSAFVVGVNNAVMLVQDFTSDQSKMAHAITELAPSGGTALWDAVTFAADKLASQSEEKPVARVLVVISDGENNSSIATLKDTIEQAQHGEVVIYTVSTRDYDTSDPTSSVGDHALRTLSELTGGAAFAPGSIRWLNGSLADIQQVLRGRYLVSYKPAAFERNGQYRPIEIKAQKDGHKLKVYARKGYFASDRQSQTAER